MPYPRKIILLFFIILVIGVLAVFIYLKVFLNNTVSENLTPAKDPVALVNFDI